jgi:hypothetical protein
MASKVFLTRALDYKVPTRKTLALNALLTRHAFGRGSRPVFPLGAHILNILREASELLFTAPNIHYSKV